MTRMPWLVRVIANFCALLLAEQGFDGGIDIEYPRRIESGGYAAQQVRLEPGFTRCRFNAAKATTHRVLADDFLHLQYAWTNTVTAQRRDMGIAIVSRQNRQQQRSQYIIFCRCVGAGVVQRAILNPRIIDSRGMQKFSKERQLTIRRGTGVAIPLHMNSPTRRIDNHRLHAFDDSMFCTFFGFTHLVTLPD